MIDNGLESVSERTRQRVFQRDEKRCWLCEEIFEKGLYVAHQVGAEEVAFASFKDNGTILNTVTDPSRDNLFPLCSSRHGI